MRSVPLFSNSGVRHLFGRKHSNNVEANKSVVRNQNSLPCASIVIESSCGVRYDSPEELVYEINETRFSFTFKELEVTFDPLKRNHRRLLFIRPSAYDSAKFLSSYPVALQLSQLLFSSVLSLANFTNPSTNPNTI